MQHIVKLATSLRVLTSIWKDRRGQDMIEYALLAGFITVASVAIVPGIATNISTVFTKVNSVLVVAAAS
jgi:pilus assembly protein Flp/PilA